MRADLCAEAIRLGRLLVALMPARPEARALLALMLLHDARRDARVDAGGEIWSARGPGSVALAPGRDPGGTDPGRRGADADPFGAYTLQAAIAASMRAPRVPPTPTGAQIVVLYALLAAAPSVAGRGAEPRRGRGDGRGARRRACAGSTPLAAGRQPWRGYHLLPAARADLLRRLGRIDEAAAAYREALALVGNDAEGRFLRRRLTELGGSSARAGDS